LLCNCKAKTKLKQSNCDVLCVPLRNTHHLTISPPHHLTTSPPHHLSTSAAHHLTTSPPQQLTTSPPQQLTTSPLHHLTTSPLHHLTTSPPHHLTTSPLHHLTTSPLHHLTTFYLHSHQLLNHLRDDHVVVDCVGEEDVDTHDRIIQVTSYLVVENSLTRLHLITRYYVCSRPFTNTYPHA
jgi:hypothetical protein